MVKNYYFLKPLMKNIKIKYITNGSAIIWNMSFQVSPSWKRLVGSSLITFPEIMAYNGRHNHNPAIVK